MRRTFINIGLCGMLILIGTTAAIGQVSDNVIKEIGRAHV